MTAAAADLDAEQAEDIRWLMSFLRITNLDQAYREAPKWGGFKVGREWRFLPSVVRHLAHEKARPSAPASRPLAAVGVSTRSARAVRRRAS